MKLILVLGACALSTDWLSQGGCSQASGEYRLKAVFLSNFARFVEWPTQGAGGTADMITICIVGEDPFGNMLDEATEGKSVRGHKLVVRRLKLGQDVKVCQIAFISSSERNQMRNLLKELQGVSVLTVGEMEAFATLGGVINFTQEGNKVHFEINTDAAQRAHLKISSKLLSLAKIVKD